jgi:protein involved in polysaccharide export with SLBB domain
MNFQLLSHKKRAAEHTGTRTLCQSLLLLVALLLAPNSPAQTNPPAATNSAITNLSAVAQINNVEDDDPVAILPVTDSGEIQVPYLGRYPAVGKTCKELALGVKAELEKKYYYTATVAIAVNSMPRSRGKIYLVGAVRVPGPQDIASDETLTVSKAILRAGGFTEFASEKNVKVTRGSSADKKVFELNVSRILEKGDTENDLTLQPGDLIYIPERMIRF